MAVDAVDIEVAVVLRCADGECTAYISRNMECLMPLILLL